MSVQGYFTVNGQMSLIDPQPRTLDVYYSMPDEPNEKTGLLVLVPGFGGNCNSKVYQKMRRLFADQYNLYVIQCEYFGSRFMQSPLGEQSIGDFADSIPESIRSKVLENYDENQYLLNGLTLQRVENLGETKSEYCEMGIVQATDILIAIHDFADYLNSQNLPVDCKRVIGYGHSHGAYLLFLCNGLMPNCFSDIIDVSAWTFPRYIQNSRYFYKITRSFPQIIFMTEFRYLVSEEKIDTEVYELNEYYSSFNNTTRIYSFHGTEDELISIGSKIAFLSGIQNCSLEVIGKHRIDNEIFKSNTHGLDADFLKLFDYVVARYGIIESQREREALSFQDISFTTSMHTYWLGYDERIGGIQMYIVETEQ